MRQPATLILALLAAVASSASAQSSVTVFGVVDVAARFVDNDRVGSLKSLAPNGHQASRLGFRGVEDLGGGLRAAFWLEHQIQLDTGTQGLDRFWARRSTVSLLGSFGEIRLGRDYTPTFFNPALFDAFGYNGVGSVVNLLSNAANPGAPVNPLGSGAVTIGRADNSVAYHLPSGLGGLYGQVMVSAGEGADANKYTGARLGYRAGAIDFAAAYGKTENDHKVASLAGSYAFGAVKVSGLHQRDEFGLRERELSMLGVNVTVGLGEIRASYAVAKMNGPTAAGPGFRAGDESQLVGVGYVHNLSRRTALYAAAGRLTNDNGAALSLPGGPAGLPAGGTSTGYEAGIRHSF